MATQRQSTRPRLMIDISPELRYRIKVAAAQKDLSIREYIEQILEQTVPYVVSKPERQPRLMNPESLARLLQARERMIQARQGRPSLESTEIIRQMREERSRYLALAEREDCEYWTADARLWNAVRGNLPWVHWLGDYRP